MAAFRRLRQWKRRRLQPRDRAPEVDWVRRLATASKTRERGDRQEDPHRTTHRRHYATARWRRTPREQCARWWRGRARHACAGVQARYGVGCQEWGPAVRSGVRRPTRLNCTFPAPESSTAARGRHARHVEVGPHYKRTRRQARWIVVARVARSRRPSRDLRTEHPRRYRVRVDPDEDGNADHDRHGTLKTASMPWLTPGSLRQTIDQES